MVGYSVYGSKHCLGGGGDTFLEQHSSHKAKRIQLMACFLDKSAIFATTLLTTHTCWHDYEFSGVFEWVAMQVLFCPPPPVPFSSSLSAAWSRTCIQGFSRHARSLSLPPQPAPLMPVFIVPLSGFRASSLAGLF